MAVLWLVRRARERGCDEVYLEVFHAGRRLYEDLGFEGYSDTVKLPETDA